MDDFDGYKLKNTLPDFAFVAALVSDSMQASKTTNDKQTNELKEPTTFREAWDHHDKEQRQQWREAIKKELRDMTNRGVF